MTLDLIFLFHTVYLRSNKPKNVKKIFFGILVAMEISKHGGHIGFSLIFKLLFLAYLFIFINFFFAYLQSYRPALQTNREIFLKNCLFSFFIENLNILVKSQGKKR